MRICVAFVLASTFAAIIVGCSQEPRVPSSTPDAGVQYEPVAPAYPIAPLATDPADAAAPPNATATAAEAALDVAIMALADKEAPGMKPEGQPVRATIRENEHAESTVTLLPGHCYTFIAMSPPEQIADVEMRLLLQPFNVEALRSGAKEKNPAFIGRGKTPTCPVAPIAIQYKIEVVAKKGEGRVLAQMFSRSK